MRSRDAPAPAPAPGRTRDAWPRDQRPFDTFFVTERTHDIELFPGCQPDGGAFPRTESTRVSRLLFFLVNLARALPRRARPKRALSRKQFRSPRVQETPMARVRLTLTIASPPLPPKNRKTSKGDRSSSAPPRRAPRRRAGSPRDGVRAAARVWRDLRRVGARGERGGERDG